MANSKLKVIVTGACGFIGLNLCRHLTDRGHTVVAADRRPPPDGELSCDHFHLLDLNNFAGTEALLRQERPDWLLHLAARTDLGGSDLTDYVDNIVPTWNLLRSLERLSPTTRTVVFSSMLENTSRSSRAYFYGLSKKRTEDICTGFASSLKITIVRPPSVWGPHFQEPYLPFFKAVLAGRFMYCSLFDGSKTFAYVGNLVAQVESVLLHQDKLPPVLYLGDIPPLSANDFAREISRASGTRVRSMPAAFMWMAGLVGSALSLIHVRLPITLFRLSNMRKGRVVDLGPINTISTPRVDLRTAVRDTLSWLERCAR